MGIDPGLAKIGWGIIKVENNQISLIDYGCINTSKEFSMVNRLGEIYKTMGKLIEQYSPEEVAIEKIFFASNAKTAINVAHARGAILLALNHHDIRVSEYTPLQIKQAVVGYGRAKKEQVQFMVKNFLNLKKFPTPDHAADALATAICHNNSRKMKAILE